MYEQPMCVGMGYSFLYLGVGGGWEAHLGLVGGFVCVGVWVGGNE